MTDAVTTPDAGASSVAQPEQSAPSQPKSQDSAIRDALAAHAPDVLGVDAYGDKKTELKKPNPNDGGPSTKDVAPTVEKAEKPAEKKPEVEKPSAEAKEKAPQKEAPKAEKPVKSDDQPVALQEPKLDPEKPAVDAPDRMSAAAKGKWADTPVEVQHEIARAVKEMTAGIDGYKQQIAERDERIASAKAVFEMADQNGITPQELIDRYSRPERELLNNPGPALIKIADAYFPGGFRALIAEATGQSKPGEQELATLKQQNERLQAQMQHQQRLAAEQSENQARMANDAVVKEFSADHPRVAEPAVEAEMIRLLQSGYVPEHLPAKERLSQAYDAAVRLNPAPTTSPAPQADTAQTREPATSISGAPSSGSSPRDDKPKTQEEAVKAALRKYGAI